MAREIRSTPLRYGLALGAFGLGICVVLGLPRIPKIKIDLTTLIIFVMVGSAWYLGWGPGLLIASLVELTLNHFSTSQFYGQILVHRI